MKRYIWLIIIGIILVSIAFWVNDAMKPRRYIIRAQNILGDTAYLENHARQVRIARHWGGTVTYTYWDDCDDKYIITVTPSGSFIVVAEY